MKKTQNYFNSKKNAYNISCFYEKKNIIIIFQFTKLKRKRYKPKQIKYITQKQRNSNQIILMINGIITQNTLNTFYKH